jgi:hypothetical protein
VAAQAQSALAVDGADLDAGRGDGAGRGVHGPAMPPARAGGKRYGFVMFGVV